MREHKDFGLSWSRRSRGLVYASNRQRRLPPWLQSGVVAVVNRVCCFVFGHDHILRDIPEAHERPGVYHCSMCCKALSARPQAGESDEQR